jgi:NAD(P)H-nitrite reductase large subunit
MATHLLIGGGIAATQAAETIRTLAPEDTVVLVAEEERPFYVRPLLADFVAGRTGQSRLWRDFESLAASKNITLITGEKATAIDRPSRTITLESGRQLTYDKLLVATGVKPRLPNVPGTGLSGVTAFSCHADAVRLDKWAATANTAVVVGRGLQGVELTRALRLRGLDVTMIVPDQSPWFPALFQLKGDMIEQALASHGVNVIPLDSPKELLGDGSHVTGVKTREGRHLKAEIVGFALDQRASLEFLVGSGVSLADGVVVNGHLVSTDERIYAAGDVAQIELDGKRRPIGYGWLRALAQGETAARNMCGEHTIADVGDESEAQALYGMGLLSRWE